MSLTANFLTELGKLQFKANIVLDIGGTFFSQYAIDSGQAVDSDKIGLILNASINGTTVDVRDVKTSVASMNFSLLDNNSVITVFLGQADNSLQGSEVKMYFGYITGSFDFSDYVLLSTTIIKGTNKIQNGYQFRAKEAPSLLQTSLLNVNSSLNGSITDSATTLTVFEGDDFPSTGRLKVGDEFLQYTGKAANVLTGLSRGDLSSTATEHDGGTEVFLVTKKDAPAMDIALDVILNDLSIPAALVDSASFTNLRDGEFSGEDNFILYIYDQGDGLQWLEEKIFIATNTRLVTINGVLTVILLDQIPIAGSFDEITEDHTLNTPTWAISIDKLVNKVIVKSNFSEGLQKFGKVETFKDDDSIAIFGESKPLTLELFGVSDAAIVIDRKNRLLARLSTPKAEMKVDTHFSRFKINVGDPTRLIHRYIPQPGGSLGFNDVLEVMSRQIRRLHKDASCQFTLQFSSYTGIRIGFISPSPALTGTIISQKEFDVPDGSLYEIGYTVTLWDNVNNIAFSDAVNVIESISGNRLTMVNDFVTVLGSNVSLFLAPYISASGPQKARYAYISPDTNIFVSDNSKAYQILI